MQRTAENPSQGVWVASRKALSNAGRGRRSLQPTELAKTPPRAPRNRESECVEGRRRSRLVAIDSRPGLLRLCDPLKRRPMDEKAIPLVRGIEVDVRSGRANRPSA